MDLQTEFVNILLLYLSKQGLNQNLKFYKITKLNRNGDFTAFVPNADRKYFEDSVPIDSLKGTENKNISETDKRCASSLSRCLIEESKSWKTPVVDAQMKNKSLILNLNRTVTFYNCIYQILEMKSRYGFSSSHIGKVVTVTADAEIEPKDLNELRRKLAADILTRILTAEGATVKGEDDENDSDILLHLGVKPPPKPCNETTSRQTRFFQIAKVHNNISLSDYYQNIQKMCEMRDNFDVIDGMEEEEISMKDFVVRFDLLKNKLSLPVKYSPCDNRYRVAIYILYNYVRLKAILGRFDEKVTADEYPALPSLDEIDFKQLTCEEEWHIVFCYLLEWPELVRNICNPSYTDYSLHTLFAFLAKLASIVSSYYGKERVLTEPRHRLLPIMFARIYLLKAITTVMENAFFAVAVNPLRRM